MKRSCWHFVSPELQREFGDHPETRFAAALTVKSNTSRKVLKADGLFLKFDKRPLHSFAREIKIARQLNEAGLPTVEMIASGKVEGKHALLSRELPGSVAFDAFLHDQQPSAEMLQRLTQFIAQWIKSPFIHRDFHAGNLLCVPQENRFVLVDLHAVRRKKFWQRRPDYEAGRVLIAPRRWMLQKEMIRLIADAGIPSPEKFYAYALNKEAHILLGEWQKRRTQILHGYPKFSRLEGDRLTAIDAPPLRQLERQRDGRAYFLAHVLLNVAGIPHRKAAELDLLTGEALLAPRPPAMIRPPEPVVEEMRARLRLYGIESRPEEWSLLPGETLPVLIDLSSAAETIERWEKIGL